jgi:hypothetical protein
MKPKELRIRFTETSRESVSIKAELRPGTQQYNIFFHSNDIPLTNNPEALLAVGLLPAMKTGRTLVADGIISQRLFNATESIFEVLLSQRHLCLPLRRVRIKNLIPGAAKPPKEKRVGIFFSAGVDSFYTFLKHQEEITDLIYLHGFDVALTNYNRSKKMSDIIRKIGLQFGKRVIEVKTNVRSMLRRYLSWRYGHGFALAAVCHLLSPFFQKIYIAATHTFADSNRVFIGSHPLLDPLWSTETFEFIHDGCDATRIQKVAMIAKSDVVLQSLRVCFKELGDVDNCGWCEKCIRTMINLHIVGALSRCTIFAKQLDTARIAELMIPDLSAYILVEENLRALKTHPENKELYNAVQKAMKRGPWLKYILHHPRIYQIRWIYRNLKKITNRYN